MRRTSRRVQRMMKTLALSFGLLLAPTSAKTTAQPEFGHAAHTSKHALLSAGIRPIKGKSAAGQHLLQHAIPLDHNGNPRKKRPGQGVQGGVRRLRHRPHHLPRGVHHGHGGHPLAGGGDGSHLRHHPTGGVHRPHGRRRPQREGCRMTRETSRTCREVGYRGPHQLP